MPFPLDLSGGTTCTTPTSSSTTPTSSSTTPTIRSSRWWRCTEAAAIAWWPASLWPISTTTSWPTPSTDLARSLAFCATPVNAAEVRISSLSWNCPPYTPSFVLGLDRNFSGCTYLCWQSFSFTHPVVYGFNWLSMEHTIKVSLRVMARWFQIAIQCTKQTMVNENWYIAYNEERMFHWSCWSGDSFEFQALPIQWRSRTDGASAHRLFRTRTPATPSESATVPTRPSTSVSPHLDYCFKANYSPTFIGLFCYCYCTEQREGFPVFFAIPTRLARSWMGLKFFCFKIGMFYWHVLIVWPTSKFRTK